tara:strand:- start:2361 stop:2633 length:273 start_codon:yes stop_codon:yes gene_type:complete
MDDTKVVTVDINVPLLRQQRDALQDMEWTEKNIHILYGVMNMMDAMLDAAELPDERPEMRIVGFDKKQTLDYKNQLKDIYKIKGDDNERY